MTEARWRTFREPRPNETIVVLWDDGSIDTWDVGRYGSEDDPALAKHLRTKPLFWMPLPPRPDCDDPECSCHESEEKTDEWEWQSEVPPPVELPAGLTWGWDSEDGTWNAWRKPHMFGHGGRVASDGCWGLYGSWCGIQSSSHIEACRALAAALGSSNQRASAPEQPVWHSTKDDQLPEGTERVWAWDDDGEGVVLVKNNLRYITDWTHWTEYTENRPEPPTSASEAGPATQEPREPETASERRAGGVLVKVTGSTSEWVDIDCHDPRLAGVRLNGATLTDVSQFRADLNARIEEARRERDGAADDGDYEAAIRWRTRAEAWEDVLAMIGGSDG